jgi:hypothetical protein
MRLEELAVNHYEVVLNKKTVALIKNALREIDNEKQ